jgi:hypothetical protein
MKKNKDEPNWVIIHIYLEISQGNSLCSYLKQQISIIFFSFLVYKIRTEGQNRSYGGRWYQQEGGSGGERI